MAHWSKLSLVTDVRTVCVVNRKKSHIFTFYLLTFQKLTEGVESVLSLLPEYFFFPTVNSTEH